MTFIIFIYLIILEFNVKNINHFLRAIFFEKKHILVFHELF